MPHNVNITVKNDDSKIVVTGHLNVVEYKDVVFDIQKIYTFSENNTNGYGKQNGMLIWYHADGKSNAGDRTEKVTIGGNDMDNSSLNDAGWVNKPIFTLYLNDNLQKVKNYVMMVFKKFLKEFQDPKEFKDLLKKLYPAGNHDHISATIDDIVKEDSNRNSKDQFGTLAEPKEVGGDIRPIVWSKK